MNDWFIELRINIKFCVKLGRNESGTCEMPSETYGEEAVKSQVCRYVSGINSSNRARISKSQMTKMLFTFFDIKGIVHFKFILQGETVNEVYYIGILKRLRETLRRKGLDL
jgi:hypothetical protein